jgi:hypothetical protein
MSVARTARRRRKQAAQGFKHMDPMRRPHYKKPMTAEVSARREAAYRERQRKFKGRKK